MKENVIPNTLVFLIKNIADRMDGIPKQTASANMNDNKYLSYWRSTNIATQYANNPILMRILNPMTILLKVSIFRPLFIVVHINV